MHIPVLLREVMTYLNVKPDGTYVDATANGGGHTLAMSDVVAVGGGRLVAIEWDTMLFRELEQKIKSLNNHRNLTLVNENYTHIQKVLTDLNVPFVDGVLFDLGMSSAQLDAARGFSFQKNDFLDMRFNDEIGQTAADILQTYSVPEIENILKNYGEERFAGPIAKAIAEYRKKQKLEYVDQLVGIIADVVPGWYKHKKIHFATKTFQALRIFVNSELENVQHGLSGALSVLRPGGRICVISFHSLEDRIVKNFFKTAQQEGRALILTKKPIVADVAETHTNPRSRSAKLRVLEKIQ